MKKINYIFYSISLLICSITLISISIIRKKLSTNQIEETTTATEVVTETQSSDDEPTNENIIEYCAENKTLWFLNAFFGVFLTSIFCNMSAKANQTEFQMFPPKKNVIYFPFYVRLIFIFIYFFNVGFIGHVIYEHRFLRIAGIFLLLCSLIFLYCHCILFYA
mgnify:CR=1 FL=1